MTSPAISAAPASFSRPTVRLKPKAEARAILTAAVDSPIERSLLDRLGEMREILDGEELEQLPNGTAMHNPSS